MERSRNFVAANPFPARLEHFAVDGRSIVYRQLHRLLQGSTREPGGISGKARRDEIRVPVHGYDERRSHNVPVSEFLRLGESGLRQKDLRAYDEREQEFHFASPLLMGPYFAAKIETWLSAKKISACS